MCAFAKCHQACKSSRDCSNGERCVQSDRPYYVCQKQGCSRSSECLGKQVCAQDGQCHDQCQTAKDCLADQVCTAGACADTTELVNGALPIVTDGGSGVGQRCTLPTDCPGDLVCLRGGVCGAECIGDKDCRKTFVCQPVRAGGPGRCYPSASTDAGADATLDASSGDANDSGALADASGGSDASGDASDGAATQGLAMQLAAGGNHNCVVLDDAKVKCWGYNVYGQLGLGDTSNRGDGPNEMGSNLPYVNLGVGRTAKSVTSALEASCALLDNAKVKCWGTNGSGELGLGDTSDRGDGPNEMGDSLPYVDLGTGRTAKALVAGSNHVCAILDNGKVKCWGNNERGQLGLGDTNARGDGPNEMGDNLPYVDLGTGRTAKLLMLGHRHTCAILDDDRLKCWGANGAGELGLGNTNDRGDGANEMGDNLPSVDLGTGRTAKVAAGRVEFTCAVLDNNRVKCWGAASSGHLGLGDNVSRGGSPNQMGDNLPYVDLGTNRTAISLSSGLNFTCARLDNAMSKCWGYNGSGQLGQGDVNVRGNAVGQMGDNLAAIDLGTGRTATSLSGGGDHTCAILDNGRIKCWGYAGSGELGGGNTNFLGGAPNQMGDNLPFVNVFGP